MSSLLRDSDEDILKSPTPVREPDRHSTQLCNLTTGRRESVLDLTSSSQEVSDEEQTLLSDVDVTLNDSLNNSLGDGEPQQTSQTGKMRKRKTNK